MTDERLDEIERFFIADTDHSRTIRELAVEVRRLRAENERLRQEWTVTDRVGIRDTMRMDDPVQIKLPPIG